MSENRNNPGFSERPAKIRFKAGGARRYGPAQSRFDRHKMPPGDAEQVKRGVRRIIPVTSD